MLNKIIKFIFKTSIAEKKLLVKQLFLTNENENIFAAIRLINSLELKNLRNSLIIDIGAYDGKTSQLFSKAFPEINILAFEANPEVCKSAIKILSPNTKIHLSNYAISNENKTMSFYITSNHVSSSLNRIDQSEVNKTDYKKELDITHKVEVEARKLDDFTADKDIVLLKIDTQGHELEVLEGAKETLKRTRFILIEMSNHNMYEQGCKYYEVDAWLRTNNFSLTDMIITYRKKGLRVSEYDAIYENCSLLSTDPSE